MKPKPTDQNLTSYQPINHSAKQKSPQRVQTYASYAYTDGVFSLISKANGSIIIYFTETLEYFIAVFFLYPRNDWDHPQNLIGIKLDPNPSSHFMKIHQANKYCIILLAKKQTTGHECNTS